MRSRNMTTRRIGSGIPQGWLGAMCALSMAAAPAVAQCALWAPGDGYPGVAGPNPSRLPAYVAGLATWDPDAGGPAQPVLVVSGSFSVAGESFAYDHATFDPGTGIWSPLGTPSPIGAIGSTAQATMPNGDEVFAKGNLVERWDGTNWMPLGGGMNGTVRALAVLSTGDVIAGGDFTIADGVFANHIARWDGSAWSALGAGTDAPVRALLGSASSVIAGGMFTNAGGSTASHVAIWDGAVWSAIGGGTDGDVHTLAVLTTGELVAAGSFTTAGGGSADNIASWDGVAWSPLGIGVDDDVHALFAQPAGALLAWGDFTTAGGVAAATLARWDGATWSALGDDREAQVADWALLPNGDLVVGGGDGYFPGFGASSDGVALERWDGSQWLPLGAGIDRIVRASTTLPNGDVIVGGDFTQAGATMASHVAHWDGTTWSSLDVGVDAPVRALVTLPNGHVVAGGDFTTAGGVGASRIAGWDGSGWTALGLGTDAAVRALAALPNGAVVAGGDFTTAGLVAGNRVAHWDGSVWTAMGLGMNGPVRALAVLPNGDVVAGGDFTTADGLAANRIARWNGSAWSALAAGLDGPVWSLAVLADGSLVAGGNFAMAGGTAARHVAHWDGTVWSSTGAGLLSTDVGVAAMATMPGGDLVVAVYDYGVFVLGQPSTRLLRWDGESWTSIGIANGQVNALSLVPSGELAVGGAFTAIDGAVSAFFGRYVSACAAIVTSAGLGCASSGGSNTLATDMLPWVDTTFRATATGLPSLAWVLALTGFTPIAQGVLPLSSVFVEGQPGCDVLVDPLFFDVLVATAGAAESQLFLINTPPLVGLSFRHQMIPIEVDGSGNFVAITATNALELVAGDF
jgi:hypothetical protein